MKQGSLKLWLLALGIVALITAPLSAQVTIQAGTDEFNTPNNGNSSAFLTDAQLDALCNYVGAPHSNPPDGGIAVTIRGQDLGSGSNSDTRITRLHDARLPSVGSATTVGIEVSGMSFVTVNQVQTNCGPLTITFTNDPPDGVADSTMKITLTSSGGGDFEAEIIAPMTLTASGAQNGTASGFYTLPSNGPDPWSVKPPTNPTSTGNFHPGVLPGGGGRVELCRGKYLPAWHCYKNAKKKCTRTVATSKAQDIEPAPCADIVPIDDDIVPIEPGGEVVGH